MKRKSIAVVGAAETTELGLIPNLSQIQLHADAALNTMADAGLKPSDIDGLACTPEWTPNLAHYLGITPTWVDGTMVGGCSFMLHVRHAAAAINEGLCNTVLITHGEAADRASASVRLQETAPAWRGSSRSRSASPARLRPSPSRSCAT